VVIINSLYIEYIMHIHPPHKSSSNFKDHLVHFLMLFLAVLLGALAENYRENYIEKNKMKEYLTALVDDLSQDTVNLNTCINSRYIKNANTSNLISLLSQPKITNTKEIYFLTRLITRVETFEGVEGTLNELEFSGGYRIIENKN